MARGELTRLTGNVGGPECDDDDCPNIYRTNNGSLVIQGARTDIFQPPEGEALVEIPETVLKEAARALGW
ncbi:hypothetical protein [Streptomyces sp. JW3]|uniref:hypothetical protein n=1 Tax=Streptomyces sp. JW3 TaxID=3456955 RepID=UPI003FA4D26D